MMKNTTSKKGNIHLIGVQQNYRSEVSAQVIEALNNAGKILKYKNLVDVAVFDAESWDVPPKMTLSAHGRAYYIDIKICFYLKNKNIDSIISVDLPSTIHHEFSHVVRANTVGYPETLLDAFIDEGIACYIESSVSGTRKIPYVQSIKNEQTFLSVAKKNFTKKISSDLHNEWFFGHGKLPNWIGYRIGFMIVDRFMFKNDVSLDMLVRMSSKDILNRSL